MPNPALALKTSAARLELQVSINAPRERVWQLVIDRPNDWWVADLRCVAADSTVTLEPRAGGHLIEQGADGGSLLWFTVIAVEPQRSLNLAGSLAPPFGGPCQVFLHLQLEEHDGGTLVRLTNSLHGHIDDASLPQMAEGWHLLLTKGLKTAAEATPTTE
ncbi:MAG: SRPBCC domain-containing protein [Planctomycetota bacterium]